MMPDYHIDWSIKLQKIQKFLPLVVGALQLFFCLTFLLHLNGDEDSLGTA